MRISLRARVLGAAAAVALLGVLGTGAATAQAATGKCPGTFQVLHNDKIGKLNLPKGPYVIRVKNMSCQAASNYFKQFLDDPDGNLPKNWKLNVKKKKFKNTKKGWVFKVRHVGKGGGGGGGGGGIRKGKCPGTFQVLHNDMIGKLSFPKGPYVIRVNGLSCKRATQAFTRFLKDSDGKLPSPWILRLDKRKFVNPDAGFSFTVRPA